jgi:hypothetical protein
MKLLHFYLLDILSTVECRCAVVKSQMDPNRIKLMKRSLFVYCQMVLIISGLFSLLSCVDQTNSATTSDSSIAATTMNAKNSTIPVDSNLIFTENVFVSNLQSEIVNLKHIAITKDTVMIFIWCKTCGACIKRLNSFKNINTRQIIAIATTKSDTIDTERSIIAKNNWNYDLYFDKEQNIIKYLVQKNYLTSFEKQGDKYFFGYPQIFMFVNNSFICRSCDKYLPQIIYDTPKQKSM